MLSVKSVRIHGFKDKRWTLRDKLNQYRGILKLNWREKKLKRKEAVRAKKQISRELNKLKKQVNEYRDDLFNDSRKIHRILQGHKDILRAYEKKNPSIIIKAVNEDVCLRRKQLDEFRYLKQKKIKEFFDLKLECAELEEKYDEQNQAVEPDKNQEKLAALCQKYIGDEKAAKTTASTYNSMLKILQKDAMYYNALLSALKADRDEQGKVLYRATLLGQLAAEDLDDIRQKYKKMSKEVWINMKERERSLKIARTNVEKLWENCRSLVRVDSLNELKKIEEFVVKKDQMDDKIQMEIQSLEETFDKVKHAMMVRSHTDMFSRFEEQSRQRERLLKKFKTTLEKHDSMLEKKNQAQMILSSLDHSMITTTGDYKSNKKNMLNEIETQKKREDDFKKLRKLRGELLIKIKAGLQNMVGMLIHVKFGKPIGTKKSAKDTDKKNKNKRKIEVNKDERDYEEDTTKGEILKLEKLDTDAVNLLEIVTKKVNILFNLSNFDINEENEIIAKNRYQKYVEDCMTKFKFGNCDPEATGILVEHEIIDTSVPTRRDVKNHCKHLVEANSRIH